MERGAHIVSMSLGSPAGSPRLYEAVHTALARGLVLLCAAGNSGALGRQNVGYPARYGSVIAVAAHDRNGIPSGFSSRGGEIDFMAPGEEIWSTWKDGGYALLSGTSTATPFVAGVAALVLAKHLRPGFHHTPIANCDDRREHLLRMAAHPGCHDMAAGYGPLLPFLTLSEPVRGPSAAPFPASRRANSSAKARAAAGGWLTRRAASRFGAGSLATISPTMPMP